ncbi:MAG: transposase [Candidatus Cloacimonadaceae bacterium]
MRKKKLDLSTQIQSLSPDYQKLQSYVSEFKRFAWYDNQLNKISITSLDLTELQISVILRQALLFHHGLRYNLLAFCIMPNHVHVVIQQLLQEDDNPYPLSKITQSWKRQSSTQIKKLLDLKSSIWQPESYDHVIRNEKELRYYVEYVLENPVQAGFVKHWQDWEQSWVNPVLL